MTRRIALTVLILAGLAGVIGAATYSAFSSTTTSTNNVFAAGTVLITDNDLGSAMLDLTNAKPGDADTSCITLTYQGSLDASVRLYATVGGGLAPYLNLTVTRGTDASPSFGSCSTFTPDPTNYIGAGAGIVYQGTLAGFPTSYATGLVDPTSGSPETWETDEVHHYRFAVTLADDNGAQGQSSTASFSWEARNL